MIQFLGLSQMCPGCFSPNYWGIPHDCHYRPSVHDSRERPVLTDAEVDRIAQRLAAILQSGKRSAEQ